MRALATVLLVSLALPAIAADEPPIIALEVGKRTPPLGIMPRCDDLTVVRVTDDGRGVEGVRPGQTLCSFDKSGGGGARQVYRIVVTPPRGTDPADGERPTPRRGRAPPAARTRSGS